MTASTRPGLQVGPIGIRVRRRSVIAGALIVVAIVALAIYTLTTGTVTISADRVIAALTGNGTRVENLVVVKNRLPPVAVGIFVGFCLGVSGALTQTVTRNPIATPDILGVTTGAGAFAVFVVVTPGVSYTLFGMGPANSLVIAAMIGGLVSAIAILLLSWRGGFDGYRLVLVGLGINAVALALIDWLLMRADDQGAAIAARWLVGSLDGARLEDLWFLIPVALIGLLTCTAIVGQLASVRLGRDVAASLGTRIGLVYTAALVVAVALVAAATAAAGPTAFVAFVAPHVALRLFATAGPPPIASGLVGAAFVLGAHVITTILPVAIPIGIVTAVIGAPALLFLMIRQLRRTSA